MANINRPMYEHFGARHLGVKGPGAMTQLEEGVMGTIDLDIMSDPAYWYIQGIRMFGKQKAVSAGGAGTYGKVGLAIEDTAAQVIIKLLRIDLPRDYTDIWMSRVKRTDFSSGPGVYGTGLDTRIPEAQPSDGVLISASDAAIPGTTIGFYHQDFTPFMATGNLPLVISPGQAIYIGNNTANADLEVTFWWAEIPAYKGEV